MPRYRPTRLMITLSAASILVFVFVLLFDSGSARLPAVLHNNAQWIRSWKNQQRPYAYPPSPSPPLGRPVGPPPKALVEVYEEERQSLLRAKDYDGARMQHAIGTPVHDDLSPDLDAYVARLTRFVDEYFDGLPAHAPLRAMLADLAIHVPPPLLDRPMRRKVLSTCKEGWDGAPDGFKGWEERLGPVGWEVEVADDVRMQAWFDELTSPLQDGSSAAPAGAGANGTRAFRRIWSALPKPVLKSDVLRYLAVLTWGGIYTDSDTQPRSHPYLWGTDWESLVPPSLGPLHKLLAPHARDPARAGMYIPQTRSEDVHVAPPTSASSDEEGLEKGEGSEHNYADDYHGGMADPDIAFVASIEWDSFERELGDNWCCGYCRALQVVQWTIMAKPFHPIMLDVLETVIRNIERGLENDNLDGTVRAVRRSCFIFTCEAHSQLDLTGPGPL